MVNLLLFQTESTLAYEPCMITILKSKWVSYFMFLTQTWNEMICLLSKINEVPVGDECVQLGWDLPAVKATACDSHQFHTHQTIQRVLCLHSSWFSFHLEFVMCLKCLVAVISTKIPVSSNVVTVVPGTPVITSTAVWPCQNSQSGWVGTISCCQDTMCCCMLLL